MNIKDDLIICAQLLPYGTGRAFSDIFLKMEVQGELHWRIWGGTEIALKKMIPCTDQIYLCGLATVSVHFWDKITVAGWESVVCRVFCVACPVFILLRHRDFIFDTLMTSIHSETLGSISFSYVCVWLTVGSMCVCGVSLRLLKKTAAHCLKASGTPCITGTPCINSSLIG